ncbi:MAG: WYL domain-containing protein [Hahellaceae bacterium]|nr:WYL domain-containing protein [Hahellaceae bacterium]MCP5211637.1 WYL domain-containing protein [Hahellaceae bacterium]
MDTFLRRLAILEYLRVSSKPRTTEEILQHLVDTDYLYDTVQHRSLLRTVQRDMLFLLGEMDEGEPDNAFGLETEQGPGRTTLWRLDPYTDLHFDFEKMPQFMAMAFAMTRKHLKDILPKNTASELTRFFTQAESRLEQSEKSLSPKLYKRLNDSIEFYQRGQRLQAAPFEMEVLDTIYRGIIQGCQVAFNYRGKEYRIHPYGVAILLPKLYLIGKKHEDAVATHSSSQADSGFRSFLINKIESIYVLPQQPALVPEDFRLKDYLEQGEMDVLLSADADSYVLTLRLSVPSHRLNLLDDLSDSPISPDQQISEQDENVYLLQATVKRTVQLRNWLLSLADISEVVSPLIIRKDMVSYLQSALGIYADGLDSAAAHFIAKT